MKIQNHSSIGCVLLVMINGNKDVNLTHDETFFIENCMLNSYKNERSPIFFSKRHLRNNLVDVTAWKLKLTVHSSPPSTFH